MFKKRSRRSVTRRVADNQPLQRGEMSAILAELATYVVCDTLEGGNPSLSVDPRLREDDDGMFLLATSLRFHFSSLHS